MSHEFEPDDATGTLQDESNVAVEYERKGYELVQGNWAEKSMSNAAGIVEGHLMVAVGAFVRASRLGLVFSESAMYQMFAEQPKLVRKPDLSFVRNGRLEGDRAPTGKMQLAPDLAVEVISPTDIAEGVETKLDEYLRAGVRLVWVVYVPTRQVWAYRTDGTARLYRTADILTGEDVLPGFMVPVAELFEGV